MHDCMPILMFKGSQYNSQNRTVWNKKHYPKSKPKPYLQGAGTAGASGLGAQAFNLSTDADPKARDECRPQEGPCVAFYNGVSYEGGGFEGAWSLVKGKGSLAHGLKMILSPRPPRAREFWKPSLFSALTAPAPQAPSGDGIQKWGSCLSCIGRKGALLFLAVLAKASVSRARGRAGQLRCRCHVHQLRASCSWSGPARRAKEATAFMDLASTAAPGSTTGCCCCFCCFCSLAQCAQCLS